MIIGMTKVWRVNRDLVIADTIEDAVKIYQTNYDFPYNEIDEISIVEHYGKNALIKLEDKK